MSLKSMQNKWKTIENNKNNKKWKASKKKMT